MKFGDAEFIKKLIARRKKLSHQTLTATEHAINTSEDTILSEALRAELFRREYPANVKEAFLGLPAKDDN